MVLAKIYWRRANKNSLQLPKSDYVALTGLPLRSKRNALRSIYPIYWMSKRRNEMTDTTNCSDSQVDVDAVNLQPEITPSNLQINPPEAALASLLTPSAERVIIAGEDPAEFYALAKAAAEFWQPQNLIEQLLMLDFIYAEWELLRLRRLVPAAFRAGQPFAVAKLEGVEDNFSECSFRGGSEYYKAALANLAAKGQTEDVLDAQTMLMHAAAFESFDKRMAVLEARRDSAWEKVERRRYATKTISSSRPGERA
jgi:hypothetical protein